MNVDKLLNDLIDGDITITISVRDLVDIIKSLDDGKKDCIEKQAYLGAATIRRLQKEFLNVGKTKRGWG